MKYKHGLAFPDADEYLFDRLPDSGVWQQDALDAGLKFCKKFRRAVDGGAHIGTWSLELAKKFEHVESFEVANDTYHALLYNTDSLKSVINTHNVGLYSAEGTLTVEQTEKDLKRRHTGARYISYCGSGLGMKSVTLDQFNWDDVDFIKLDLEGAEPDALDGALNTLRNCRPVVVFEDKGFCVKRFGRHRYESQAILSKLGAVELAECGINKVWGWV